jgi:hypothetical protein
MLSGGVMFMIFFTCSITTIVFYFRIWLMMRAHGRRIQGKNKSLTDRANSVNKTKSIMNVEVLKTQESKDSNKILARGTRSFY